LNKLEELSKFMEDDNFEDLVGSIATSSTNLNKGAPAKRKVIEFDKDEKYVSFLRSVPTRMTLRQLTKKKIQRNMWQTRCS